MKAVGQLATTSMVVSLLFGLIVATLQQPPPFMNNVKQRSLQVSLPDNAPAKALDDVCGQGHSDVSAICLGCAVAKAVATAVECCNHGDAFELCVAIATGERLRGVTDDNDDNDDDDDNNAELIYYGDSKRISNYDDDDDDDDNNRKLMIELQNRENREERRKSPFLGKRRNPFLGKRRSPFLGKRIPGHVHP